MALALGDIADNSTGSTAYAQPSGAQISLSQIATGFLQNIANSASTAIGNKLVSNQTRSSNTQPVPDLTAAAAAPSSSFLDGQAFGVSMPVLLVGAAALVAVLVLRK